MAGAAVYRLFFKEYYGWLPGPEFSFYCKTAFQSFIVDSFFR
jgi:hypothetical protein